MTSVPAPTVMDVQNIVMQRTANARTTAFWLWLFLGGINAHIAYLNPKNRWLVLVLSILVFIGTAGFSGLFWLVNWMWLGPVYIGKYRDQVHAQVEADLLRRRMLYGG